MRRWLLLAALCSGCGASSPTAPTSAPVVPVAGAVTLSGRATATNGGYVLAGATVTLGAVSAQTAADGSFTAALPLGNVRLAVTGVGLFPRSLVYAVSGSRTVAVDAIALAGFDPAFYRMLVRNTSDAPKTSEPLRRWTRTPNVYLKTVDEAGEPIHPPTLDMIESVIRAAVPQWTSGALSAPVVTRGTGTMVGVSGWLTVRFPAEAGALCGQAQVGQEGGWLELTYHIAPGVNCRAPGYVIAPRVVRHELGHALGFWHTDSASDIMWPGAWALVQADQQPSPREVAHAALAYRRPVGNMEPDEDPGSVVSMTAAVAR